jgi:uncharacterized membrane protein
VGAFGRNGPIAVRASVAAAIGAATGVAVCTTAHWIWAPAGGWITAMCVYLVWTWAVIAPMTAAGTAAHATREDPTRVATDLFILTASMASLMGVALLFTAGSTAGAQSDITGLVSVGSVAAAWLAVHTVFTLRYASLYYGGSPGGVDFNQEEDPAYTDFAYLAFTIGMTYQVSDTDLRTRPIRATALRQALLSYLLGAIILAVTINLVAGLAH